MAHGDVVDCTAAIFLNYYSSLAFSRLSLCHQLNELRWATDTCMHAESPEYVFSSRVA